MKKNTKYKIHSSIVIVGVLAVIIAFNVLVSVLIEKFPIKIDLTSQKLYEISDVTRDFLKSYTKPTDIFILAGENAEDPQIKNIVEKYRQENSNITVQNIDIQANPTFGQKYVTGNTPLTANYVIIDGGERFKTYKLTDLYDTTTNAYGQTGVQGINVEQKLTSGLQYVSSESNQKAYFLTGHNETELVGAKQTLTDANFEVAELNLLTEDIPADCSLLVVGNPSVDFTTAELQKIDGYMSKGGDAQFFFYMKVQDLSNLYSYIKEWGIQVDRNIIIEEGAKNTVSIGELPLGLAEYETNDITEPLIKSNRSVAYMPFSKYILPLFETNNGIEVKKILSTSSDSYITDNMSSPDKTPESKSGSMPIAALATRFGNSPDEKASIFVSGTPLLMEQDKQLLEGFGMANSGLYLNVTNSVLGETDNLSIPSKSLVADKIIMTATDQSAVQLIVIVIPILALVLGIIIWSRRRHL